MFYTRLWVCTPMLYRLEMRLLTEQPLMAKIFVAPLLMITVFNLLSLLITGGGVRTRASN